MIITKIIKKSSKNFLTLNFVYNKIILAERLNISLGRLAQLVERLPYKEDVRSSSLLTPTIKIEEPKGSFFIDIYNLKLNYHKHSN